MNACLLINAVVVTDDDDDDDDARCDGLESWPERGRAQEDRISLVGFRQ